MPTPPVSRRDFVKASALTAVSAGALLSTFPAHAMRRPTNTKMKVGLIGCGGRGTGAAIDILNASQDVELGAVGDVFQDRVEGCMKNLEGQDPSVAMRCKIDPARKFVGFDAYKNVLATDIDIAILTTAPGFRAQHFAAAIEAGKHVFFEKPVAVDPTQVRQVLAAGELAATKKLSIVTGTQRRHEQCYLDAMKRIHDGAIGRVTGATVYWNQGGLWMHKRKPDWTDMEWQLRNWLYFTWLSGDHIVEQHVHNLDVGHWALGTTPKHVIAMGGRQVRTSPDYGHIFDHFACEFEYADGRTMTSYCRQIDGCQSRVDETIHGTEGYAKLSSGHAEIYGKNAWKFEGPQRNPYEQEHVDLIASITGTGPYLNEAKRIAESTLHAIMGRMSAYTGKVVTWEQAMNSRLDLMPKNPTLGPIDTPEVAVPGKTGLI